MARAVVYVHVNVNDQGGILHNLGMIVQFSGLWMVIRTGNGIYGMVIALGGATIILATLWLVSLLWGRLVPH